MGLSNAISGGIILFGITYVIFTFAGFIDTAASLTETSSMVSDLEIKLIKTSIDVTIEEDPGTDSIFNFNMTNTNSEKLWDFEKFDVIITYDDSGITYTETQTYVSSCPPVAGEWCIVEWYDDILDPQILNDDETIKIRTMANNSIDNNSDLIVIVSTPNGVVASDAIVV